MSLKKGQPVRTPHPKYMGTEKVEGVYDGDADDHVVPPTLDGRSERIPQGRVRYPDGSTKVWMLDAIEPI